MTTNDEHRDTEPSTNDTALADETINLADAGGLAQAGGQYVPLVGVTTQVARIIGPEGAVVSIILGMVDANGHTHEYVAPASGVQVIHQALAGFRDDLNRYSNGDDSHVVDLVLSDAGTN